MNARLTALVLIPLLAHPALAAEKPDSKGGSDMDFDFFKGAPKEAASPEEVEAQVKARRGMLTLHQGLGFATWASMGGAVLLGQLQLMDKYPPGMGDTGVYFAPHLALALTATALFTTTALLGLLAPVPFKKPFQLDAAAWHKIFMSAATAGMLVQVALGFVAGALEGSLLQRSVAQVHQIVGYSTLVAMSFGAVVLVF